jgi:hypothetical protein
MAQPPARSWLARLLSVLLSPGWRRVISVAWFPIIVIVLSAIGFILIVLYAFSMAGPHLRYLSVGLLTASAALLTGSLAGLIVGVPRDVSSGALRATTSRSRPGQDDGRTGGQAGPADTSGQGAAGREAAVRSFEPSTNLAEISDWLTKLLLGAGLVSLTRLGRPLGRLIHTVARGLGPHGAATGAAIDTAAAILIGYAVLGFLVGYLATTLWYGKRLQAMFRR